MPISSGAQTQLSYLLEGTNGTNFGVLPVAGTPTKMRRTDDGLGYKIQTQVSEEINSSRGTSDTILVGASADGPVNYEFSYKEYDAMIEAALQGTWAVYGTGGSSTAGTMSLNSTTGVITYAGAAGADQFTNLEVGQWFRLVAPSDAANNSWLKVGSRTTTAITVDTATPLPGTGTRASVANCQVQSSRLKNGSTMRSFSMEREHTINSLFLTFLGMNVNKWTLNLASGSKVGGTFEYMGASQMPINSSRRLPNAPVAAVTPAYDIMNAVTGVGQVFEAGAPIVGTYIKNMTFNLDNKLRGRDGIGYLGSVDVASGTLEVSGNISVYFASATQYNKFIQQTRSSLSFRMTDNLGNGYVVSMPSVKYSAGEIKAGNKDSDSMVEMSYQALIDPNAGPTQGFMITVDRFGA